MAKDMVDRTEIDVLNWKGVNKNDKKNQVEQLLIGKRAQPEKNHAIFPNLDCSQHHFRCECGTLVASLTVHYIYIYTVYSRYKHTLSRSLS